MLPPTVRVTNSGCRLIHQWTDTLVFVTFRRCTSAHNSRREALPLSPGVKYLHSANPYEAMVVICCVRMLAHGADVADGFDIVFAKRCEDDRHEDAALVKLETRWHGCHGIGCLPEFVKPLGL